MYFCTLREDLLVQVRELATEGKFDYLLIEKNLVSPNLYQWQLPLTFVMRME